MFQSDICFVIFLSVYTSEFDKNPSIIVLQRPYYTPITIGYNLTNLTIIRVCTCIIPTVQYNNQNLPTKTSRSYSKKGSRLRTNYIRSLTSRIFETIFN